MKKLLILIGLIGVLGSGTLNAGMNNPGNHSKQVYHTNGRKVKIKYKNDGTIVEKTYYGRGKMNPIVRKYDKDGNLVKMGN